MQRQELIMTPISPQGKVLGNLIGSAIALEIAAQKTNFPHPLVVLCSDSIEARRLSQELRYLCPKEQILDFLEYETLPYDILSPHQDIISSRLEFLSQVPSLNSGLIVTSVAAFMQRLSPCEYVSKNSFILKVGDKKDVENLRATFVAHGYLQVEQVLAHGEFAIRGSILDVFPMGSTRPLRIDFFDDEVDSIAYFDVQNQRSQEKIQEIKLLPANEFPLDKESISIFRSRYRDFFANEHYQNHVIYQAVSKASIPAGIEYYLPLFFAATNTLFDYLSPEAGFIVVGNMDKAIKDFDQELHTRHKLFLGNLEHPPLPVYEVFLRPEEINEALQNKPRLYLTPEALADDQIKLRNHYQAPCLSVPNIAFDHHDLNSGQKLCNFVQDFCQQRHGRILITAVTEGRRQNLRELIPQSLVREFGLQPASNIDEFLSSEQQLMMTIAPFEQGVLFDPAAAKEQWSKLAALKLEQPLAILTETELLGFKIIKQRHSNRQRQKVDQDAIIKNLAQLQEGQIVVHIDHGIGRYRGLKTEVINGVKGEYLAIEYQNGDMLSIPITSLNKVARYSGESNPPLSRLGTDVWSKKKNKAAQKVRDVAAELLDIYAQRELKRGFAFKIDEPALDEFVASFPYEETEDQHKAIEQTLADMQKPIAMDRLICGDVGFGKTEVALRAAFVAASNGKQVAVLAPTTILAEQHFQNFRERFASTAMNVDMLSRFRSPKEQKETIAKLANGQIDIIIGTHRLLSTRIKFKDLGLLIIDEEHRFGVRQKEKLKALRAEVDLLTLTATPIPRTLNMAMEGMRELSIIATPPEHRLAVKTFIHEDSNQLCREAIMRELHRGGQVYYLHNDVATMELKAEQLAKLVPEAKIEIAHGQMDELQLQNVMKDFYHQRFNVLLCSTIIENGLDIPTANTIIIDRADRLGMAQLHQIRGRVGRSHHQAYAYFFTPPKAALGIDAKRRLEAIASIDELGAGFILASHDLEIRGAGELLGEEQSGQIESIGFSLYMDMLNAAVAALKDGREPTLSELSLNECDVDMHLPALFPDSFIRDVNTRLSTYKRLASCMTPEQFDDLKIELIDRFGDMPQESENLFTISRLKRVASILGISKIRGDENGASMTFEVHHKVHNEYILSLIQKSKHGEYRIMRDNTLRYNLKESDKYSRLQLLDMVLKALYTHSKVYDEQRAAARGIEPAVARTAASSTASSPAATASSSAANSSKTTRAANAEQSVKADGKAAKGTATKARATRARATKAKAKAPSKK